MDPQADSALFLFAHPDDEFGALGALGQMHRAGRKVVCLFLTDGSQGRGRPHMQRRRLESTGVLRSLGVAAPDIHFPGLSLGLPDGGLPAHLEAARAVIAGHACDLPRPALYMPAWEGGHPDHDATHLAGLAVARTLGVLASARQFPLYHGAGLCGPLFHARQPLAGNGPIERLPLNAAVRLRHLFVCTAYRSQWHVLLGLLPALAWAALVRGDQCLQAVSLARSGQRPHPGPLLYERRGALSHAEFRAHTQAFRERWLLAASTPCGAR